MSTAVILGAGFSHAVSSDMPLTERLGALMLEGHIRSGASISRPPGPEGFERWLSRYAEPQPDLTDFENLENRALFTRLAIQLRQALMVSQSEVMKKEPPWWLRRLIGAMHYSGDGTFVTFNYDTIIECALDWCRLVDEHDTLVGYNAALRYAPSVPYQPPPGRTYGDARARTFSLLKLHGSIDSFWVSGDVSGATISRWDAQMRFQHPVIISEDERRQVLPGREPFIIPPAAAKSSFYQNPVTREIWQQAAKAIREADEVAIIGYSLPLTDLATSAMLGENLRTATSTIVIVNPDGDAVASALYDLGIDPARIRIIDDATSGCEDYVSSLEEKLYPTLSPLGANETMPVAVGKYGAAEYEVLGVRDVKGDVVVLDVTTSLWANGSTIPAGPTVGEIRSAAGREDPRVRLAWTDGNTSWVANCAVYAGPSGTTEGILLRATAQPARVYS